MNKKILIVTYHYPPIVSAGIYRLRGIANHLTGMGWKVTVLTVDECYSEPADDNTLEWMDERIEVIRTGNFDIDKMDPEVSDRRKGNDPKYPSSSVRQFGKIIRRALYAVAFRLFSFPDRHAGWFLPLFKRLRELTGPGGFDLVLSSSPPHSSHLPAALLKSRRRFKWIADFRDPWTVPPYYYGNKWSLYIARRLERFILGKADAVIANTQGNKYALLETFKCIDEKKIYVINNAFDPDAVLEHDGGGVELSDITYTGEVYEGMLDLYIEAIDALVNNGAGFIPRLAVYGRLDKSYDKILHESAAGKYIEYKGSVSFDKSIEVMRNSNSLLLVLPHTERGRTWVPSKLYAYLFSGRPILAIGPDGDASRIIEETRTGAALKIANSAAVAGGIIEFFSRVERADYEKERDMENIEKYSMKHLAHKLEKILLKLGGA